MLIHRNVIKSLVPATADADTRYPLQGIYVDPESRECIATNGRILIRAAAPSLVEASEFPSAVTGSEPIHADAEITGLLDADALLTAAKATPRSAGVSVLEHVAVTSPTAFVATDLEHQTVITGRALKGKFPAWRQVLTVPQDANTFTLSAELLATIVKVAKAQGRQNTPCVTFHVVPDQLTKGVYFEVRSGEHSPKIDGVVMPLRI